MRKKVLFFTAKELSNVGGGERVLAVLASGLSEKYDITVLTPYVSKSYYSFGGGIKVDSLNLSKSKGFFARKFQLIAAIVRLWSYLRKANFDKIVVTHSMAVVLTSFVTWKKDERLIAWIHQSYYQKDFFILRWFYLHSLSKFMVVATNTMDVDEYKKITDRVCFINNPLSFHIDVKSTTDRKRLISVGRLSRDKGFDFLIKICSKVFRQNKEWVLDIYGQDDGEKQKCLDLIKSEGMEGRINILEPVRNIHDEMVSSSVFVFCSLIECFGLVLLEACECGLPCVAFNSPSGIRDIVKDGYNGYLVDMYDCEQFMKSVLKLIEDDELRRKMGKNATEFASQFTDKKILTQWYDLLG